MFEIFGGVGVVLGGGGLRGGEGTERRSMLGDAM